MNTIDLLFENTKIKGKVILSDSLHENKALLKDKTLYKFIWVLSGQLELDVDHQPVVLKEGQLLTLYGWTASICLCCSTVIFIVFTATTMRFRATDCCFTVPRMSLSLICPVRSGGKLRR